MANRSTGHLLSQELFQQLREARLDQGYEEVPLVLSAEANDRLAGRPDTMIPKDEDSVLAEWMREGLIHQAKPTDFEAELKRLQQELAGKV